MLFEVYANGRTWIKADPFNPASGWSDAGTDPGLTSPRQLTVGRTDANDATAINVYKATNGKLFQYKFPWQGGPSWQELTNFSAKGKVLSVSGDIVAIDTGNIGLSTLFHISTGQQIIDRQYGLLVGSLDFLGGSGSAAYFARFIPGTTTNQEAIFSNVALNRQYGPSFGIQGLRGLAVAVTNPTSGSNSVFMLLPVKPGSADNFVLMLKENNAANNIPVTVRNSLSRAIAAATSYEVFGAGFRSYLWTLTPASAGGDVLEYKCSTSCGLVPNPPLPFKPYVQVVATSAWTLGDPDM